MKFSQKFVTYHGCGNCYLDGTNKLEQPNNRCFAPTYNPFWKRAEDSNNKIAKSTRNQLQFKSFATRSYFSKYFEYLRRVGEKNFKFDFPWKTDSDSDSDYSTDDESNSDEDENDTLK